MNFKYNIRKKIIDLTGYWIYKKKDLPAGIDFFEDIKNKLRCNPEIVFDIGANIGQTAVSYNYHFKNARIYSFEPVLSTFEILKKNVAGFKRINCFNIAFGEKVENKPIILFDDEDSCLNSLNENSMNTISGLKTEIIKVTTLDDFALEQGLNQIDLLKTDTEGYELNVLSGASQLIKKQKIFLILVEAGFSRSNKRHIYFNDIHEFMSVNNYLLFAVYDYSNIKLVPDDFNGGTHFANMFYISSDYLKSIKRQN